MEDINSEETIVYKVVLNDEEQFSIWFKDRKNPLGWKDAGMEGTKQECLDHINKVWVDMRPRSLREHLEALEKNREK